MQCVRWLLSALAPLQLHVMSFDHSPALLIYIYTEGHGGGA